MSPPNRENMLPNQIYQQTDVSRDNDLAFDPQIVTDGVHDDTGKFGHLRMKMDTNTNFNQEINDPNMSLSYSMTRGHNYPGLLD